MPARDGGGWLLRLFPEADTVLLVLELLVMAYCLWKLCQPLPYLPSGEEKLLLLFFWCVVLPGIAALIGIATWFACLSVLAGVGAAVCFCLCTVVAMMYWH